MMTKNTHFSQVAPVFHGKINPEEGTIVGYAAIIHQLNLAMPLPSTVALVCKKNKKFQNEDWKVFPPVYLPEDNLQQSEIESLYKHLVFALKYEGINLLVFRFLGNHYTAEQLSALVQIEPTGQYSRKIWFLIEWLTGKQITDKEDLSKKSYVKLVDEKLQYAVEGIKSPRHLIINNLAGTVDFCPLISKTEKLERYINKNTKENINALIKGIHKEVLLRTSSFLLLKDSKASFSIEGENPAQNRALRWGKAIGQAGSKPLSKEELYRLQQIVIENSKFITMGYRTEGGFVGEHDRTTGEPIPEHISARPEDIENLMNGWIAASKKMETSAFHPILSATCIAFGFVFIHPFVDGNGRLHRYLIHHLLSAMKYSPQGIIFPVSASILERIEDYAKILESHSHPLLDFIQWEKTQDNNITVLNETADYYRYFDATKQAEFLCECIDNTIHAIIPAEVAYLQNYDAMKLWLDNQFQMPDKMVALLMRFLEQNNGLLSQTAKEKEFTDLTEKEVKEIEENYQVYFN
jgi:hypothetical protein